MTCDLTGAAASFAHHFVCAEEEFLRARCSPVQLIRQWPFLGGENDLPEDRELNPSALPELMPCSPTRPRAASRPGPPRPGFRGRPPAGPPVDHGRRRAWPLLETLYAMLPRAEAAQLSFSTLFGECSQFVDWFRLVTVPDEAQRRRLPYVFEGLTPTDLHPVAPGHDLGVFWCHRAARGRPAGPRQRPPARASRRWGGPDRGLVARRPRIPRRHRSAGDHGDLPALARRRGPSGGVLAERIAAALFRPARVDLGPSARAAPRRLRARARSTPRRSGGPALRDVGEQRLAAGTASPDCFTLVDRSGLKAEFYLGVHFPPDAQPDPGPE